MPDYRVSDDWADHPKTVALEKALGPRALRCLHRLWGFATRNRPEGKFTRMTDEQVAKAAGWKGDPGRFIECLLTLGWLDRIRQSRGRMLSLHDWADRQPWVIGSEARTVSARYAANIRHERERAERMRTAQKKDATRMRTAMPLSLPTTTTTTPPLTPPKGGKRSRRKKGKPTAAARPPAGDRELAHAAGYQARADEAVLGANPHPERSEPWVAWKRGWQRQHRELGNDPGPMEPYPEDRTADGGGE